MIRKRRWVEIFKPKSLQDYWTVATFLVAIVTLFVLRGMDLTILFFFLFPPFLAFFYRSWSNRKSTRMLCMIFLTLLSAGITLAPIHQLFPNLGGVDSRLSPNHNRILSWYAVTYLLYMIVLPTIFFLRALLDYYRGLIPQFSQFTCILGLLACLLLTPGIFWVCFELLGLDSIWSSEETDNPQAPPGVDSDRQIQEEMFTIGIGLTKIPSCRILYECVF
jgi:hypothetical protein